VHFVLSLALVDQVVTMTAQKVVTQTVKESYPPTASGSRTDEPRPLPAKVAGTPVEGDVLLHIFPLISRTATMAVK
jgi:hypothetical protein